MLRCRMTLEQDAGLSRAASLLDHATVTLVSCDLLLIQSLARYFARRFTFSYWYPVFYLLLVSLEEFPPPPPLLWSEIDSDLKRPTFIYIRNMFYNINYFTYLEIYYSNRHYKTIVLKQFHFTIDLKKKINVTRFPLTSMFRL